MKYAGGGSIVIPSFKNDALNNAVAGAISLDSSKGDVDSDFRSNLASFLRANGGFAFKNIETLGLGDGVGSGGGACWSPGRAPGEGSRSMGSGGRARARQSGVAHS